MLYTKSHRLMADIRGVRSMWWDQRGSIIGFRRGAFGCLCKQAIVGIATAGKGRLRIRCFVILKIYGSSRVMEYCWLKWETR